MPPVTFGFLDPIKIDTVPTYLLGQIGPALSNCNLPGFDLLESNLRAGYLDAQLKRQVPQIQPFR
jgi:hypothetical protein